MRKQEHPYEIYELKDGFDVTPRAENRPILKVRVDKNGFWYIVGQENYDGLPLYNFYVLLERIIRTLYETWKPGKTSTNDVLNVKIRFWAQLQTKKTLAKKINKAWKNCCNNLDPEVNQLHKKLHSVSNGSGSWNCIKAILNNREKFKYLIDDMIKYPAARIAVLHADELRQWGYNPDFAEWDGDWMKAYACNNEMYTSLNKTLMNLPYGVTYYFILNLKYFKLPEPATTRIRLFTYTALSRTRLDPEIKEEIKHVILRSSDEDLKEAIRYIWKYFPMYGKDNFRRRKAILHSLNMIFDYPLPIGDWDIIGLAKRSEAYHHDLEMQERARRLQWEKENEKMLTAKTALPPIPLPRDENIRFLDSYKSVHEEGELMKHCIASYAGSAVKGWCYLFHVDYKGEMASVEVNADGYISQSYGPADSINKASEYGRRTLGRWGKQLANKTPVLNANSEITYLEVDYAPLQVVEECPF